MTIDTDHASALVRAFFAPERRDRYLGLLASPRGREKLRAALAHLHDLDWRFAHAVPSTDHTPTGVVRLLRARGVPPHCVLLAEGASLDGRRLPLDEAVTAVVGRGMGALVSCVPGRLAYYEGEDRGARYVLERGREPRA